MDIEWESKLTLVSVHVVERIKALWDHAPILLTTGTPHRSASINSSLN
jgi:hypothetical protein